MPQDLLGCLVRIKARWWNITNQLPGGDSSRDLVTSPNVGGHQQPSERVTSTHHPKKVTKNCQVGGETSNIFLMFTPIFGEMIQFDDHIFQQGWFNHQLVNIEQDLFFLACLFLFESTMFLLQRFSGLSGKISLSALSDVLKNAGSEAQESWMKLLHRWVVAKWVAKRIWANYSDQFTLVGHPKIVVIVREFLPKMPEKV